MKPTSLLLAFPLAITTANAWHLQLYKDESYVNEVVDRSGTLGQPCASNFNSNVISSMHWDAEGVWRDCEVVLYNSNDCTEQAGILGRSRGNWHVPNFSSGANDKVSSYKINC